jgi:16S rRNA (uracil1498-N3)-methyltransferase
VSDRFYTADPLGPGEYALAGPEAHHLAAVRRFAPGDRVVLFNGDGNDYPAEILSVGKRAVALTVLAPVAVDRELPFPLVVGSALPKGDRADFLIEKLTELGVTRFVPLLTARAVVQPRPAVVEKFARAVIEASKQCGRNRLMAVDAPQKWEAFVARADLPAARLVLHPGPGLASLGAPGGRAVAVGPEGGFAPEEVALAAEKGWLAASLGPRVLRVETAAVVAAALAANSPASSASTAPL